MAKLKEGGHAHWEARRNGGGEEQGDKWLVRRRERREI